MSRSTRLAQLLVLAAVAAAPASAHAASRLDVEGDSATSTRDAAPTAQASRPRARTRIVGGTPTDIAATPWLAALMTNQKVAPEKSGFVRQFCGGALVHPQIVLTAAHCISGEHTVAQNIEVVLGRTDLNTADGSVHDVSQIVVASGWDPQTFRNDFALLVLAQPAAATPIALAGPDLSLSAGQMATAMGWGDLGGGNFPTHLQSTPVPLVSSQTCVEQYRSFDWHVDPATMICAGWPEGGRNTCKGDSGGPLVVRDAAGAFRQAGIVSWADRCAIAGRPTVFAWAGSASLRTTLDTVKSSLGVAATPATAPAPPPVAVPSASTAVAHATPRVSGVRLRVRRSGRRVRLTLRFQVTDAARISVQIQQRRGARYIARTNRRALRGTAGRHNVRLSGAIPRGSYRLVLKVTGANAATTVVNAPFRISR